MVVTVGVGDKVTDVVPETVCVSVSFGDCVKESDTVTVGNEVTVVVQLRVPETVGRDSVPVVTVPVVVMLSIVSETVKEAVGVADPKVADGVVETESEAE